jgi:hypothetical protein
LELGVAPKTGSEGSEIDKDQLIFKDEGTEESEKMKKLMSKMVKPEIKLLNLDEEENRDKEAMIIMMRKYGKIWKNLYYKYSNSGFSSKN